MSTPIFYVHPSSGFLSSSPAITSPSQIQAMQNELSSVRKEYQISQEEIEKLKQKLSSFDEKITNNFMKISSVAKEIPVRHPLGKSFTFQNANLQGQRGPIKFDIKYENGKCYIGNIKIQSWQISDWDRTVDKVYFKYDERAEKNKFVIDMTTNKIDIFYSKSEKSLLENLKLETFFFT